LTQESQKTELWIARYGLWKLLGAKRSFEKVLGVFVFLSGWKVLAQMTGAFAKFGNFLGIFGGFLECLDLIVIIFQKPGVLR
jgi:hypothetical protein